LKDFKPLAEVIKNQPKKKFVARNKVIKNPIVNNSHRVVIETPADYEDDSKSEIQPIIENGEIVGMIYRCSCGRISEIRFEYEIQS